MVTSLLVFIYISSTAKDVEYFFNCLWVICVFSFFVCVYFLLKKYLFKYFVHLKIELLFLL